VQSPYLPDEKYFPTGDAGRLLSSNAFSLLGRIDSIVKIEEKRIALDEVENRLRESSLVEDAHVVALERSRQFLAALIVLSPAGRSRFAYARRREITAHFRAHLLTWFEPTVLPRKWRYVESVPRDAQGKVLRETVLGLFDREEEPALSQEPVVSAVERDGSHLAVSLHFPADSVFFDGHFPSFRLLPAVVQVDWVMRLLRRHLGITEDLREIVRLKFSRPILPGVLLRAEIRLDAEKDQIQFRYLHRETGEVFSSGTLKLERRS
jgi:3-hydroxymyristoyl/3-hydroxydecanoyl-(acyl carrier protein) dehydratase